MLRLVSAFAIAPVAPLLILAPLLLVFHKSFTSMGPFVFMCVFYGYPAALLLGAPLFLLHRKKQWLSWWQVTIAASLIGALMPVALVFPFAVLGSESFSFAFVGSVLSLAGVGAAVGALSGLSFWFVGLRPFPKNAVEP